MSQVDKPKGPIRSSDHRMGNDHLYDKLLRLARDAYRGNRELTAFAAFPDDVERQPITPLHRPCGDVLRNETGLSSQHYGDLQDAIIAAGPAAVWRETYKGTNIGDRFLQNFGCYSIIGKGGPFTSRQLWLWVVHMPAGLYYPWHHHPGEEAYMVVSGSAVFKRQGCSDEPLREGDTVLHQSNQPHAMETLDAPVLCLVAWRNGFDTPPVLTSAE